MDGAVLEDFEYLLGTDESTIDEKGRLLLGKKKRDRLGENFTVCLGTVGCLAMYPKSIWDELVKSILKYDPTNLGREMYTRLVLGQADNDLKFDGQGRVVVPPKLREEARIREKGAILVIGCGDHVEIWAREEYQRYQDDPEVYGHKRREQILQAKKLMREWE